MAVDGEKDDENYLPDLNNELAGEQIILQQRVFRTNQAFIKVTEEIIAWFEPPSDKRAYTKSHLKNKNSWHKHMKKYSYNRETGVLYKQIVSSDGIGKNYVIFPFSTMYLIFIFHLELCFMLFYVLLLLLFSTQREVLKLLHL